MLRTAHKQMNKHMYDNSIELTIEGLTRGRDFRDAYILVLREKPNGRFYPVLISQEAYNMVSAALDNHDYTCSRLMNKLAGRLAMKLIGIRLLQPNKGQTQALLDFKTSSMEVVSVNVSAAEAAVAALETHTSIWIEEQLFSRQNHMPQTDQSMALPLAAMTRNLLEEVLQSAVADDNFELASILRDELNKRKSDNHTPEEA